MIRALFAMRATRYGKGDDVFSFLYVVFETSRTGLSGPMGVPFYEDDDDAQRDKNHDVGVLKLPAESIPPIVFFFFRLVLVALLSAAESKGAVWRLKKSNVSKTGLGCRSGQVRSGM